MAILPQGLMTAAHGILPAEEVPAQVSGLARLPHHEA
jgi:hypothetical protein